MTRNPAYDIGDEPPPSPLQQAEALKELGDCYAAVNDYPRARHCYLQALQTAPSASGPYVGLGAVAMQAGNADEAAAAFRAALRHEPACAEACGGLAMIHQQQGRYVEAFEMYLRCLDLNSDNLFALLGLFQTSCQMGTFGKIIDYLELYLDRHSDDTSVLFCLASLYAREGRLEQARASLLSVLELEPGKSEAADLLRDVDAHLAARRPQGAIA